MRTLLISFMIICLVSSYQPTGLLNACECDEPNRDDLTAITLSTIGYTPISLEKMNTGHLIANVLVNNSHKLRLICDSGSGGTILTPATVLDLGLDAEQTSKKAGGVGGAQLRVSKTTVKSLQIGDYVQPNVPFLIIDLSHVNQQFKSVGEKPVDGIIGSDWMSKHNSLLDISGARMFIKPIHSDPKSK